MEVSLYATEEEDICSLPANGSNNTEGYEEKDEGLYIAYNVMLAVITCTIMFSMGSGIRKRDLLVIVKRPVGPIIGLVCQFLIMPAACFGYALLLQLAPNLAIGMVLVGCCPGGSISNIICFWTKSDACLSVCMTTCSTTLAIGFLPLNMFIYSRYWIDDVSNLPYLNMVVTVLYVWAAVVLGFIFGKIFPKSVPYLTKIGSVAALLLILSAGVIQGQLYPELFDLPWTAWVGAITMPIIGCLLGFILALILCQKHAQRSAIGLETGIQNTALALTVIAITFPSSYQASCYSQFVLLYTTFQVVLGIAVIVIVWFYYFIRYRQTPCNMKHSFDNENESEASEPGDLLAVTMVKGDAYADNEYTEIGDDHKSVSEHDYTGIKKDSSDEKAGVYSVGADEPGDVTANGSSTRSRSKSSRSPSSASSISPPPTYDDVSENIHM